MAPKRSKGKGKNKRFGPYSGKKKASRAPSPKPPTFEELDLDVSYVGKITIPAVNRRPKQVWVTNKNKPITHMNDVPSGWNTEEPDLDPLDYDAQLARCDERIQEEIMPAIFEWKKKQIETEKATHDEMMKNSGGRSQAVVSRLKVLGRIIGDLQQEDEDGQLVNATAIKAAYEDGSLDWNTGLVTYWSKGERISEPRPFDSEEFMVINKKYGGTESFWVEGLQGPGPVKQMVVQSQVGRMKPDATDFGVVMSFALRIPGSTNYCEFPFQDDTGSSVMTIYQEDLDLLKNLHFIHTKTKLDPPLCGMVTVYGYDGQDLTEKNILIEVNLMDTSGQEMSTWDRVECIVRRGSVVTEKIPRLNGPWLRYKLYTGTAPWDGTPRTPGVAPVENSLYVYSAKSGLQSMPTIVDLLHNAKPPPLL
ncbi:uncharacterized protein N7459_001928 [Penicillium hispanicum]|uniref:uncharacterized protein n=1 Tax=Penicillium hispanicum TaxID=1080232 RepID=UPI00254231CA|nr:uncharacterized protein N7459_001928 [Penicillium hispanicum]KAJ5591559.1 hypothetical protein N7459_001928 [Penicillium hispanicum]